MGENSVQIEIEDNATFTAGSKGYEDLQRLFDISPGFEQVLTKSSLRDLNKSSKLIIFPPCAADFGGEDPEKDDRFIIKRNKNKYESGNLVGFIGYGKERLTIKSRFGDCLFLYLLEKVLQIQVARNFEADIDSLDSLDILCLLFPFYLKSAMTKGLYKEYIEQSYNDSNLRGKLDISRFIKEDIPFMGKVSYSCREFSFDNGITELIRCTIDYIEAHKHLSSVLSGVQEEAREIKVAAFSYRSQNRERIIAWNKRHSIKNGFYSAYRPLQTLCLDILQNHKASLGAGPDQIYGVLFDCAWLWEEYVNLLIGDQFYHPSNTAKNGKQHLLFSKGSDGKIYPAGDIFPDFISRTLPRVIADAKYRHVDGIKGDDFRRMVSYLWRFNSSAGYFIFPIQTTTEEKEERELNEAKKWFKADGFNSEGFDLKEIDSSKECQGDLAMIAYGVPIPGEKDYEEFSKKMDKNGKNFADLFLERVKIQ